ncbi:MAG: hypothetical protein V4584_02275 [Verrucomicrobiota bacterium]
MRRISLFLLFLIGAAELYYVAFVVNFTLYANEQPIAQTVGVSALSNEKQRAYWDFYQLLSDQWDAIALFGIATILLAAVLSFATRPATTKSVL